MLLIFNSTLRIGSYIYTFQLKYILGTFLIYYLIFFKINIARYLDIKKQIKNIKGANYRKTN